MKRRLLCGCVLVAAVTAHALPRDANGWTVFTPSPDTRLI
jgi:hypothetical protein